LFYGGQSGPPTVVSYKFDDVVNALNQITPYNWAGLLRERINSKSPRAPLNGIENGGWKLTYTDTKNATMDAEEQISDRVDLSFSLGVILDKEGAVLDAIPGSPAYLAGVGPGMKIIGVNNRKYSKDVIRKALRGSASSTGPIELLVENADYYRNFKVDYHGGERYPHLVRNEPQADLLNEVIKPLAQAQ
jgi:predicted metalloprotease with PDZ domain